MTEGHLVLVFEGSKGEDGVERLLLDLQPHPCLRCAPHNQECGARQPCGQQGERHHELAAKSQVSLTLRHDSCRAASCSFSGFVKWRIAVTSRGRNRPQVPIERDCCRFVSVPSQREDTLTRVLGL